MQMNITMMRHRRRKSFAWTVVLASMCGLLATGQAFAQDAGNTPAPGQSDKDKPAGKEVSKEVKPADTAVTPKPRVTTPKTGRKPVQPKRRNTFTPDPNAKYVCTESVVTRPPVWRGEKNLTFNFFIRNEGTADLQIRAKGG